MTGTCEDGAGFSSEQDRRDAEQVMAALAQIEIGPGHRVDIDLSSRLPRRQWEAMPATSRDGDIGMRRALLFYKLHEQVVAAASGLPFSLERITYSYYSDSKIDCHVVQLQCTVAYLWPVCGWWMTCPGHPEPARRSRCITS